MSYHESSHERLCQIVTEQERQIAELTRERDGLLAKIDRLSSSVASSSEAAASAVRELHLYRDAAAKTFSENEQLTRERDEARAVIVRLELRLQSLLRLAQERT